MAQIVDRCRGLGCRGERWAPVKLFRPVVRVVTSKDGFNRSDGIRDLWPLRPGLTWLDAFLCCLVTWALISVDKRKRGWWGKNSFWGRIEGNRWPPLVEPDRKFTYLLIVTRIRTRMWPRVKVTWQLIVANWSTFQKSGCIYTERMGWNQLNSCHLLN